MVGLRANQKPISTPPSEPMTKASIASTSVIQRCRQIVPSANHFTIRDATSSGVEKKNGGSSFTPPIGTVVRMCHSAIDTTATRICKVSSVTRLMSPSPRLCVALHHLTLERFPDFAMQLVECALQFDLTDCAGTREGHFPVADDARRGTRRHDHHAVRQCDCLFEIVGHEQHGLAVRAPQVEQ